MRIITGHFKGTRLHAPTGSDIRPTADRLRESIFSIIGPRIRGKRVLDLYAGTGAMGIEALSRGASRAVFIDHSTAALDLIRRNLAKVRAAGDTVAVMRWDIAANLLCLGSCGDFDIVFIDPPYRRGLIHQTLANLAAAAADFGMIVVEHDAKEPTNHASAGFLLQDQRRYGKILVSFLSRMV